MIATQPKSRQILGVNQQSYQALKASMSLNLRRQLLVAVCDNVVLQNQLATQLENDLAQMNWMPQRGNTALPGSASGGAASIGGPSGSGASGSASGEGASRGRSLALERLVFDPEDAHLPRQVAHWVRQTMLSEGSLPQVQVLGIEQMTRQPAIIQNHFLRSLEQVEALLPRLNTSLLVWVPWPWLRTIQSSSPTFWKWRNGVFEFVSDPTPATLEPGQRASQSLSQHAPTQSSGAGDRDRFGKEVTYLSTGRRATDRIPAPGQPTRQTVDRRSTHEDYPTKDYPTKNYSAQDYPTIEPHQVVALYGETDDSDFGDYGQPTLETVATWDTVDVAATTVERSVRDESQAKPVPSPEAKAADAKAADIKGLSSTSLASDIAETEELALEHRDDNFQDPDGAASEGLKSQVNSQALDFHASGTQPSAVQMSDTQTLDPEALESQISEEQASDVQQSDVQQSDAQALDFQSLDSQAKIDEETLEAERLEQARWQAQEQWFAAQRPTRRQPDPPSDVAAESTAAAPSSPSPQAQQLKKAQPNRADSSKPSSSVSVSTQEQRQRAADDYFEVGRRYRSRIETGERGLELIEPAIAAYEGALRCLSGPHPDWGSGLNDLGTLYWLKAQQLDDSQQVIDCMSHSMDLYNEALDKIDAVQAPDMVCQLHSNLGAVSSMLATQQNPVLHFKQAADAYVQALSLCPLSVDPQEFSTLQNSLGSVYWKLSHYEQDKAQLQVYLQQAITAYQQALLGYSPHEKPLDYAAVQNNLGITYWSLAKHINAVPALKNAIAAYRDALNYRTPDNDAAACAITYNNLALAYWDLSKNDTIEPEPKRRYQRNAITAFEAALQTANSVSALSKMDSAAIYHCLGDVHAQMVDGAPSTGEIAESLQKSLHSYVQAIDEVPMDSPIFETRLTAIVANLRSHKEHLGLASQQAALNRVPSHFISLVMQSL